VGARSKSVPGQNRAATGGRPYMTILFPIKNGAVGNPPRFIMIYAFFFAGAFFTAFAAGAAFSGGGMMTLR
jgi:hypothetical protein